MTNKGVKTNKKRIWLCLVMIAVIIAIGAIALFMLFRPGRKADYVYIRAFHPINFNEDFTESEYQEILEETGVTTISPHGNVINYRCFYQADEYSYKETLAETDYCMVDFHGDGHSILGAGLLSASELEAGALPEDVYDVVLYGDDESIIGTTFTMYLIQKEHLESAHALDDPHGWYYASQYYIGITARVTGLQTDQEDTVYLSETLCDAMLKLHDGAGDSLYAISGTEETGILDGTVGDDEFFVGNNIQEHHVMFLPSSSCSRNEVVLTDGFMRSVFYGAKLAILLVKGDVA